MRHEFRVIAGCPVPKLIAPYIWIITHETRATVNSIYRGDDARAILNAHGKHTQRQLWEAFQNGTGAPANPPGFSTHEQKSDGVAYPQVPRGHDLPWWGVGFDVNDADTTRVINRAHAYGWDVFRPYHSGAEFHHLDFRTEPKPRSLGTKLRLARIRAVLPRH